MKTKEVLSSALDLFYPRNCIITGEPADNKTFRYLSTNGFKQLHITEPPACITCGSPFEGEVENQKQCPKCCLLEPVFKRGKNILCLNDAGMHFIHSIKYNNGLYLLHDVAALAKTTKGFVDFIEDAILIPVPLYPLKLRQRGYNQSLEIAQAFCHACERSEIQDILIRTRDTGSQTHLDRKARIANIANAFSLKKHATIDNNRRYVVVDDVFTTGATLNACCRVLEKYGAKNIDIVTLGHG